ncbi:hypothetical protein ACQP2E_15920 [Actinoplanes sp. CA-015351]|uniref:hypothetical protein n=1 Tax=Actinoplanes sp. CA-015351 TaxID=3239897 RepID=UPI003D952073
MTATPDSRIGWLILPDRSRILRVVAVVPAMALPSAGFLLDLVYGTGADDGLGAAGVAALIVLFALPVGWYLSYTCLFNWRSRIEYRDGVLRVRNWVSRSIVVAAPISMSVISIDASTSTGQMLVLGNRDAAALVNPRQWSEPTLMAAWHSAGLPSTVVAASHSVQELRRKFPRLRIPLRLRYPKTFTTLWTVGAIGYIGLVINVFARI